MPRITAAREGMPSIHTSGTPMMPRTSAASAKSFLPASLSPASPSMGEEAAGGSAASRLGATGGSPGGAVTEGLGGGRHDTGHRPRSSWNPALTLLVRPIVG